MINNTNKNSGKKPQRQSITQIDAGDDIRLHSGRGRHYLRMILVTFGVIFAGVAIGALGLFFLFQGGVIENDALNNRIERSITTLLGRQYEVRLGPTRVEFKGASLISITSNNVEVLKAGESTPIATIGQVVVGVPPMSLLDGRPKINSITFEASKLDIGQYLPQNNGGIPKDINKSLSQFAQILSQVQLRLSESEIKNIGIKDSLLIGFKPGPRSMGEVSIVEFLLEPGSTGELNMRLEADTGKSMVKAKAVYNLRSNGSATVIMNFDGVDVREWLPDPDDAELAEKFIASNSLVKGQLNLEFNADKTVQQPVLNLVVGKGKLRLGRKGKTSINQLALNFRLFPRLNRLILERSQISVGGLQARIVGGVTPVDPEIGLAGDVDYTLVVEQARVAPSQSGEKVYQASMLFEGEFDRTRKLLSVDQWKMSVVDGDMVGSASLGFDSETPSLVLNGISNGMPLAAVKQYWPIFLATKVRQWVGKNVHGGRITSATVTASIPGGILGRIHRGKRIGEEQLVLDVNVEGVRFDTFGDLPPVRSASGNIKTRGMRTDVALDSGVVYAANGDAINIEKGRFTILDAAERPLNATTTILAKGKLASVAEISNAAPLNIMERLKMAPGQWSGGTELDVVASFPLKKKLQFAEVDWQALVRLKNASSSKPITGRKITRSNVVIDVNPDKAVITGNSTIDGVAGKVLMIEPIGKSSKIKRKRVLNARLNDKDRQKMGLELNPVISGIVDVQMEQNGGQKAAEISVDLKNAVVALPWIGWRKGVGIPAKASFKMINERGVTKISGLKLRGQGFAMNGELVIDKNGVRSANFPTVSLNKQDDLAVRIRRKNNAYTITANGKYFDGRVLVNKLFKQNGVASEQGTTTFALSANIDKVKGFGNRFANNLVLNYSVKKGWLDALNLNTRFGRSQVTTIVAGTTGNTTNFEIRSQNAGSALSFLDLYSRMEDGVMAANLSRRRGEPFRGNVVVKKFVVVDEPKLKKLVSNKQLDEFDRGGRIKKEFNKIQTNRVPFLSAQASIEKGEGYLSMDGSLTGVQIGMTYNGLLYDKNNRMNIGGTFMPAFGISRMVSAIPFVGQILSNGKDSGLIGITYRLSGPVQSPKLVLNPLSIVAPGIFKKAFEPRGG